MKTKNLIIIGALLLSALALAGRAQSPNYIAYDVPYGTVGNQAVPGLGVGNDFRVVQPITISQLGVFVSGTNGIQGSTVLTVQLYERTGRHEGTLLETLSFDAGSPGTQAGGNLFKPLAVPVTLLPGNYTIVAYGFDTNNPEGNVSRPPYDQAPPIWTMHDGGGLIQFEGLSRYGIGGVGNYPGHVDKGPVNRYAAGTFVFAAGALPAPSYAADYAFLVSGVATFPISDTKHIGSIAVLDTNAFPVLVEHGGNRLVMEAAGTSATGARVVAFSHFQFESSATDARMRLFENAIQWAAKKGNPSTITIGIATNLNFRFMSNLDYTYFTGRGYHVFPFNCQTLDLTNGLPPLDVLVLDDEARYVERITGLVNQFTAEGGGLVLSATPRYVTYLTTRPAFPAANSMLAPFNLAFRPSLASPADLTFTNIQSVPHPVEFAALPAAELLYADRVGQIRLDGQQKAIALNTIMYASAGQPQLLQQLSAVYAGTTNGVIQYPGNAGDFVNVVVMNGAQATNLIGRWAVNGKDLVAQGRRGAVEFQFATPAADKYQFNLAVAEAVRNGLSNNFNLTLVLDGQNLGRFSLFADPNGNSLQCLSPYILAGPHTLRIFWDNQASYTALRIKSLAVQTRLGPDTDGNGIKDWVDDMVAQQSGLDVTNATIGSYVSPACLEGRDPYLKCMSVLVEGADNNAVNLAPRPEPNGRWYVNAPLSAFVGAQITLQTVYQNGARTETRNLAWVPINLLSNSMSEVVVRQGDSLLFNAKPANAPNAAIAVTVGTNQYKGRTTQPLACKFNTPGFFTVTGTYNPAGANAASGSMTVEVVGQVFTNNPDAWVGKERQWDLVGVSPEAVLVPDARLFFMENDGFPNNGRQITLLPDRNDPRLIMARVGTNGPVLDMAQANDFQMWSGNNTYTKVLQTYPDGSELVEMMVIVSPMPSDLSLELDVVVGGVTFDDGTTVKTLTPADFDALGQTTVQFIRPASARTSVCHVIRLFQGSEEIGNTL